MFRIHVDGARRCDTTRPRLTTLSQGLISIIYRWMNMRVPMVTKRLKIDQTSSLVANSTSEDPITPISRERPRTAIPIHRDSLTQARLALT
jgi:hypothetical protein